MKRTFLKSKLHRARVTRADLDYEGSISIDPLLMKAADLLPYERVEIYNVTNGNRLATYVIEGETGSGEIGINGAAAHLAKKDDLVIIASFVDLSASEQIGYEPRVVLIDPKTNQPKNL